jgi:hypothetical protein
LKKCKIIIRIIIFYLIINFWGKYHLNLNERKKKNDQSKKKKKQKKINYCLLNPLNKNNNQMNFITYF